MRKIFTFFVMIFICTLSAVTFAAETPACVLINFSNDTRYKEIKSEVLLSELVLEKLLESGKFNIVETKPINEDIEAMLYDVKAREIGNLKRGINQGNFNELFEGPGFDPIQAESIATAEVGQIVTPSITSKIGKDNNAEYLIQGTIINLGKGTRSDDPEKKRITTIATTLYGMFTGNWDPLRSSMRDKTSSSTTAIGLQSDLRIIKASTGEVIWNKKISGYSGKKVEGDRDSIKKVKLESEMYASVVENAANEIVKLLIKDLAEGKLFVK